MVDHLTALNEGIAMHLLAFDETFDNATPRTRIRQRILDGSRQRIRLTRALRNAFATRRVDRLDDILLSGINTGGELSRLDGVAGRHIESCTLHQLTKLILFRKLLYCREGGTGQAQSI